MHIVGVSIIENCKRGMKKQVGKSQLFTKESLTEIQDKMRKSCIKSFNKFYDIDFKLKGKQKGRNQDINVKDMGNYRVFKKKLKNNEQKIVDANKQTDSLNVATTEIENILDGLKPTKLNKNNVIISSKDVQKLKDYTKNVKNTTNTMQSVNDLNTAVKEFEHSTFEVEKESRLLKYQTLKKKI